MNVTPKRYLNSELHFDGVQVYFASKMARLEGEYASDELRV